jgi:hypothetical protein
VGLTMMKSLWSGVSVPSPLLRDLGEEALPLGQIGVVSNEGEGVLTSCFWTLLP